MENDIMRDNADLITILVSIREYAREVKEVKTVKYIDTVLKEIRNK